MVTSTKKETWLHRVLPDSVSNLISDEEQGSSNGGPRRAIGYMSSSRAYSDNVAEEIDEDEAESTPQRTIEESVQTVRNAISNVETVVEQHHHHSATENAWSSG
jgi:intergrase/recombinase